MIPRWGRGPAMCGWRAPPEDIALPAWRFSRYSRRWSPPGESTLSTPKPWYTWSLTFDIRLSMDSNHESLLRLELLPRITSALLWRRCFFSLPFPWLVVQNLCSMHSFFLWRRMMWPPGRPLGASRFESSCGAPKKSYGPSWWWCRLSFRRKGAKASRADPCQPYCGGRYVQSVGLGRWAGWRGGGICARRIWRAQSFLRFPPIVNSAFLDCRGYFFIDLRVDVYMVQSAMMLLISG